MEYIFKETGLEGYVNKDAKVVIVGLTPGNNQMGGINEKLMPQEIKRKFAFRGEPMRSNLVEMLNLIGVNEFLGIKTCKTIWDDDFNLVEMTSLLKRGTYMMVKGQLKMVSKAELIAKSSQLKEELNNGFVKDCSYYKKAKLFVACGPGVYNVLTELSDQKIIKVPIVGIAHPSGQNGNWVNCYMKKKKADTETLKKCENMRNKAIAFIQSLIKQSDNNGLVAKE